MNPYHQAWAVQAEEERLSLVPDWGIANLVLGHNDTIDLFDFQQNQNEFPPNFFRGGGRVFHCLVCSVWLGEEGAVRAHCVAADHRGRVEGRGRAGRNPDPRSLHQLLEAEQEPVVGLEQLVEWRPGPGSGPGPLYTCQLCRWEGGAGDTAAHLLGVDHRRAQLLSRYPVLDQMISEMDAAELKERAREEEVKHERRWEVVQRVVDRDKYTEIGRKLGLRLPTELQRQPAPPAPPVGPVGGDGQRGRGRGWQPPHHHRGAPPRPGPVGFPSNRGQPPARGFGPQGQRFLPPSGPGRSIGGGLHDGGPRRNSMNFQSRGGRGWGHQGGFNQEERYPEQFDGWRGRGRGSHGPAAPCYWDSREGSGEEFGGFHERGRGRGWGGERGRGRSFPPPSPTGGFQERSHEPQWRGEDRQPPPSRGFGREGAGWRGRAERGRGGEWGTHRPREQQQPQEEVEDEDLEDLACYSVSADVDDTPDDPPVKEKGDRKRPSKVQPDYYEQYHSRDRQSSRERYREYRDYDHYSRGGAEEFGREYSMERGGRYYGPQQRRRKRELPPLESAAPYEGPTIFDKVFRTKKKTGQESGESSAIGRDNEMQREWKMIKEKTEAKIRRERNKLERCERKIRELQRQEGAEAQEGDDDQASTSATDSRKRMKRSSKSGGEDSEEPGALADSSYEEVPDTAEISARLMTDSDQCQERIDPVPD